MESSSAALPVSRLRTMVSSSPKASSKLIELIALSVVFWAAIRLPVICNKVPDCTGKRADSQGQRDCQLQALIFRAKFRRGRWWHEILRGFRFLRFGGLGRGFVLDFIVHRRAGVACGALHEIACFPDNIGGSAVFGRRAGAEE